MMIIITEVIRKKNYYEVHAENAVYEVDGELQRLHHIQAGERFEEDFLLSLHQKSRFRRAYRRACFLLDDREYSYCMMYQKLMHTYEDKALCTSVMEQLVQCGAIDDRRYARKYAEYLAGSKQYGLYRIRQEMLRKGLDKQLIEESLRMVEEITAENLSGVLEKKFGRLLTDPKDFKSREKVIAGMIRLGYDYQSVRNAVEDYFAEQTED